MQKPARCAYQLNPSRYDPNLLKSTYRDDYHQHKCPASVPYAKYAYQPNNAKFNDETEYKTQYVPNQISFKNPGHCHAQYQPNPSRFDGKTTYKEQFIAKKSQVSSPHRHFAYQQNKAPFYATTTYGQMFQPYKVEADRPHTACHGSYVHTTAKFDAKSSYNDVFICFIQFYKAPHVERPQRCFI